MQVLSVIPDQDTFYDFVDSLEDQGLERIIQRTCKSRGVRSDIVDEFMRYEASLRHEDNTEPSSQQLDLIENVRYTRHWYTHSLDPTCYTVVAATLDHVLCSSEQFSNFQMCFESGDGW